LLFLATKQSVATKYISLTKNRPPISYFSLAKSCVEAARQNSVLTQQLLASDQAAVFSTLDYHYAFTAAIVLQLARLVPGTNVMEDSERITILTDYLCKIGDKGNESARDCARMVMELGAVVSRLTNHEIQTGANETSLRAITNSAIAQIPERITYLPGHDLSLTAREELTSSASFLDLGVLRPNESEVYQELFSWFENTTF
jgi:hypothetical protein